MVIISQPETELYDKGSSQSAPFIAISCLIAGFNRGQARTLFILWRQIEPSRRTGQN